MCATNFSHFRWMNKVKEGVLLHIPYTNAQQYNDMSICRSTKSGTRASERQMTKFDESNKN